MEIPVHFGGNYPKLVQVESGDVEEGDGLENQTNRFKKIDPYKGSWGLHFLELELSNPTDIVFETSVSVDVENSNSNKRPSNFKCGEFSYPKTRIDRDYTARVLIPLDYNLIAKVVVA
ncbi:Trafficking protein particle complex II-specific subunit protein [Forsythia ovata]|uniref:Trafficking protein particle complex II-specific subunit protein n=1 Tax=Forsythia ovata TaxID=205694 RepID=A0ABD1R4P3_9LAMI